MLHMLPFQHNKRLQNTNILRYVPLYFCDIDLQPSCFATCLTDFVTYLLQWHELERFFVIRRVSLLYTCNYASPFCGLALLSAPLSTRLPTVCLLHPAGLSPGGMT